MGESEISRIRQQISTEYISAKLGLSGLASGYSKHQYITARQERIGDLHLELRAIVGNEQAIQIVADTLVDLPEHGNREILVRVLLQELGESEETRVLIDWIRDLWETLDMLTERFGEETTIKIIRAPEIMYIDVRERDEAKVPIHSPIA